MIHREDIPKHILEMCKDYLNPLGERYYGDRRYRPICHSGVGNAHRDVMYCKVGAYEFTLIRNYDRHTDNVVLGWV